MQQRMRRSGLAIGLLALGVLVGGLTASPAQAASGAGPYLAEPAWDRKLPAATRFLILTNWNSQAVLDKETGLVWEKAPGPNTMSWFQARESCMTRTTGNRKGWRLPVVQELASLVDPAVPGSPTLLLPVGHPFTNVTGDLYWSATTNATDPSGAWVVGFGGGDVVFSNKTGPAPAWCVRGGMNADAY